MLWIQLGDFDILISNNQLVWLVEPFNFSIWKGIYVLGKSICGYVSATQRRPLLSLLYLLRLSFFKKYIYWLCYYSYPMSPPSLHSILPTPSLPHSPPIVHVHGSYIYVLWLLHFLHYSYLPPVYFLPTIYATYSLYLSPLSPPPTPLLITLHVISISVVLFLF